MKKLLSLLAVAALFAGCEKIEGQLNITKDVKLVSSKGESRTLKVGTYSADIKANTSKKITLRLNNDSNEQYAFNVPNGSLPSNGAFSYKSATVGQPVDLSGNVVTTSQDSSRRQTSESCQYQRPVQVCAPTPNGGMTCSIQYQTVFGQRWIQYYDRTTTKDITLSIAAANATEESAQFQGATTWVDRIVLSQTQCM